MSLDKICTRTSDCRAFRRCFRKWKYCAAMKGNLTGEAEEVNDKFWFGSGIHFALEDYHGYNRFGDPREALLAYYEAHKEEGTIPDNAESLLELGWGMLTHYLEWYPSFNSVHGFETVWLTSDGVVVPPHTEGARPLVEESFELDLGLKAAINPDTGYTYAGVDVSSYDVGTMLSLTIEDKVVQAKVVPVHFHGTVDKVVMDKYGKFYIADYKTAINIDTNKLENDDQISRYMWALEQWLHIPISGFLYIQLVKDVPKPLRVLKNGEFSVDSKQKTTSALVRKALLNKYGTMANVPSKYMTFLNNLISEESQNGNKFINISIVNRTKEQKMSAYHYIMAETHLMLNLPDLALFPSPTRDCSWDCDFRDLCILEDNLNTEAMDELAKAQFITRQLKEKDEEETWVKYLKYPDKPYELELSKTFWDLPQDGNILNIILPDKYTED